MATLLAVTLLAAFIPSPLLEPANPRDAESRKAPWYFLWLQEVVTDTTVRARARAGETGPHRRRRAAAGARGPC